MNILNLDEIKIEQARLKELTELIEKHHKFVPGISIGIVKEDSLYLHSSGVTKIEGETKVENNTLFSVSSVSKVITALLVMRLVEAGVLELEKRVCEYLPDFRFREEETGKKITLAHLLNHTSGLDSVFPCFYVESRETLREHVYQTISRVRLICSPGSLFHYSSANYNLLGYICTYACHMDFKELLDTYIAVPLGLSEFEFNPKEAYRSGHMACGHQYIDRRLQAVHRLKPYPSFNPSTQMLMNVTDLSKIASLFINEGEYNEESFLGKESFNHMLTPGVPVFTGRGDYYGFGMCFKGTEDVRIVHEGVGMGYYSRIYLSTERRTGLVILANSQMYGYTSRITHQIIDKLAATTGRKISIPTAAEPSNYQFHDSYFAVNGKAILLKAYYLENGLYLDYFDLSNDFAYYELKVKKNSEGQNTVLIETELKKIGFYLEEGGIKVEAIILAEICCRALSDTEKSRDYRKYCGIYRGYFEDSSEKKFLYISEDSRNNLRMVSEKRTSWRLVSYPFDENFFSSTKGLIEFNKSGKSGFWLNYMQYFEKMPEDSETEYGCGHSQKEESHE